MSHLFKTLLVACVATSQLITGCSDSSPESTTTTTVTVQPPVPTVTSTVTATPSEGYGAPLTLTEGNTPGNGSFVACNDGHSGIATDITSCPFALNVRQAYLAHSSAVVYAYSPVTNKTYDMQCQPGFTVVTKSGQKFDGVRCVGGNNAVVVIF